MITYVENSKDSTKKLLKLINTFGMFLEYKFHKQKLIAFLYTRYN